MNWKHFIVIISLLLVIGCGVSEEQVSRWDNASTDAKKALTGLDTASKEREAMTQASSRVMALVSNNVDKLKSIERKQNSLSTTVGGITDRLDELEPRVDSHHDAIFAPVVPVSSTAATPPVTPPPVAPPTGPRAATTASVPVAPPDPATAATPPAVTLAAAPTAAPADPTPRYAWTTEISKSTLDLRRQIRNGQIFEDLPEDHPLNLAVTASTAALATSTETSENLNKLTKVVTKLAADVADVKKNNAGVEALRQEVSSLKEAQGKTRATATSARTGVDRLRAAVNHTKAVNAQYMNGYPVVRRVYGSCGY